MKSGGEVRRSALIVYARLHRRTDAASCLSALTAEFTARAEFNLPVALRVKEVDVFGVAFNTFFSQPAAGRPCFRGFGKAATTDSVSCLLLKPSLVQDTHSFRGRRRYEVQTGREACRS